MGDLAIGPPEARSLLEGAGVEADEARLRDLLQRTEGWPAGLYIAALAIKSGTRQSGAGFTFTGDDVYMGDYLRSELLAGISAGEASSSPARRSSTGCADLCATCSWSKRDPEPSSSRWKPGTCWCSRSTATVSGTATITCSGISCGPNFSARSQVWSPISISGRRPGSRRTPCRSKRSATPRRPETMTGWPGSSSISSSRSGSAAGPRRVLRWMEWLGESHSAEHYGAIAVHGSLIFALLGRPSEAERWAAAAERASPGRILPRRQHDGGHTRLPARDLVPQGHRRDAARRAARLGGAESGQPYRATMLYTEGVSFLLEGDPTRAGPILARALNLATASGSLPLVGLILAEQCGVAAERNDWAEVTMLAEQAAAIVENGHFGDYWTSALVYAWASRAAAHGGDVSRARFYLGAGFRLRAPADLCPAGSVRPGPSRDDPCLHHARRPRGGRGGSGPAHGILQQRPDLGVLPELASQLQAGLATGNTRSLGASSLTAAELRLLPLLSTHLSYAEIGERLYVSKNTVKTQAYSAYRKLGVSSRSEAVVRTRELGLDAL